MSLRGIENQMVVTRTADYARDASAQIRQGAVAQDYLAHQNKVLADMQREQVQQLQGKEAARIRMEERKEQEQKSKKKKKAGAQGKAGSAPAQAEDLTVGTAPERILDIEI